MRPTNSLDPYQVNKKVKKNGQQVNNNNNKSPTCASRGTLGTGFVDSHQFQGRFLRLVLMEMDSLGVGSLQVYKKGKVRLQDVEHMNRLRLRCDRSIGRNDWSLLGAHVCSAIEACKQAGRLASM